MLKRKPFQYVETGIGAALSADVYVPGRHVLCLYGMSGITASVCDCVCDCVCAVVKKRLL